MIIFFRLFLCLVAGSYSAMASAPISLKAELLQTEADFCALALTSGVEVAFAKYAAPEAVFLMSTRRNIGEPKPFVCALKGVIRKPFYHGRPCQLKCRPQVILATLRALTSIGLRDLMAKIISAPVIM